MAQPAANRRENTSDHALVVQAPRLPYPADAGRELGFAEGEWKALVDAIYPSAKTVDGVVLALRYCKARGLDPFKRAVHVVPMWNTALGREVETVWPGINELRTTASRTKSWAGNDECVFGPSLKRSFEDSQERGRGEKKYVERASCPAFDFAEWAQVTVYRIIEGQRVPFVGPKVRFVEIFSGQKGLRVPNARWQQSPFGQLEKCAEAAALRRAFPEELANDYTAEEMEGKDFHSGPTVDSTATVVSEEGSGGNPEPKPRREADIPEWERKGIPKACWDEIQNLQQSIDDPATTPNGLRSAKEKYVDAYAAEWPTEALDELELRFDTAIAKHEDDVPRTEQDGEGRQ